MKSTITHPHQQVSTWQPPYISRFEWQQLAGWTITLMVLAIGYTYAASLIAPVLEKVYELLIQKNMLGL